MYFPKTFDDLLLDVGNTSEVKETSKEGINIIAKFVEPLEENQ